MHLSTRSICKNTFTKSTFITTMQLRVLVIVRVVHIQFGTRCSGMTAWLLNSFGPPALSEQPHFLRPVRRLYLKRLDADSGGHSLTPNICSSHQTLKQHLLSLLPLGSNTDALCWRLNGPANSKTSGDLGITSNSRLFSTLHLRDGLTAESIMGDDKKMN